MTKQVKGITGHNDDLTEMTHFLIKSHNLLFYLKHCNTGKKKNLHKNKGCCLRALFISIRLHFFLLIYNLCLSRIHYIVYLI